MNRRNPFDVLGLPTDPALTDEQIRAAWRAIAAATHPDRPDGGDLARYTQAGAAYAELRTPLGTQRSLGRHHRAPPRHHPPCRPPRPAGKTAPRPASGRCSCCPNASATAARSAWPCAPPPPSCCRSPCSP
jgi:hypothetical protein